MNNINIAKKNDAKEFVTNNIINVTKIVANTKNPIFNILKKCSKIIYAFLLSYWDCLPQLSIPENLLSIRTLHQ